MNGFRQSHAVVIGINGYGNGIPPLRTAVNDARRIAEILETEFGYAVQLLTEDVTLAKLSVLLGEHLPIEVQADDRLLVYFAGHGIALDGDDGPAGYLVPQDARSDDRQSFLPMTDLSRWIEHLPCRHLLLVLDCCFAGAFRWSSTRDLGALPEVIHKERFDRYIRDPAWQVITSAAYDQKALDVLAGDAIGVRAPDANNGEHSPFAAGFMRALQGEADLYPRAAPGRAGGDGVITATELYLFLRECVEVGAEDDGHRQTPGLWPLKRHDKGEYIHLVPGHELDLPLAPELNEANNPYRGLQSYDEEHAPVFFGRSQFVKKLAERVAEQPLTIVLGASGTGKSSVVKAGLLSYLRATEPATWQILPPIRPGKSPLASLASLTLPGQDSDDLGTRLAEFWTDPEALATRVGAWAAREPAGRLLLVVDQFEELITLCWHSGECDQFLRLLERALAAHEERLRVVLTLRSDFEPQFAHTPLQDRWMSSRIVVPAMTLDEYREVIEGPASVKVLYFQGKASSQEFINRLISDVANTPGALPLLSFSLSELYRRYLERRGDDRSLREDDYERLGGVGGSLRNRADEVYDELPDDDHRRTMRNVMLRMISVEGVELARRHVPDDELVFENPEENLRVQEVIRRLTEARLVVEGKESDDQPYTEPAHDELVRGWDRLRDWTREGLGILQLRQVLSPSVHDWCADREPDPGKLWHANPRLALLATELGMPYNWGKYFVRRIRGSLGHGAAVVPASTTWLNRDESRFVTQSLARKHRTTSNIAGTTLAVFAALLGLTLWAFRESGVALKNERIAIEKEGIAKEQTRIAEERERIATSRQLAALSGSMKNKRLDLSLLLAVEAVRVEKTFEAPDSIFNALLERPGIRSFLHTEEGNVSSVAFSPDGKTLAAGYAPLSGSGGVVLWDVATRKRLVDAPLAMKEGNVSGVAFSPDGRTVAAGYGTSGRSAGGVVLWDVATRKRLADEPLAVNEGYVYQAAFSPDGKTIAASYGSSGSSGGVVLWDVAARKRLADGPLAVREGSVGGVAFSPDGKTLAAGCGIYNGGGGGGVVLWDVATRKRLVDAPLAVKEGNVSSVAFSPDGNTIAAGYRSARGGVVLWDTAARKRLADAPLAVNEGDVYSVAFSPNGNTVAAGYGRNGSGGGVVVWDVAARKRLADAPLAMSEGDVRGVAFSPDGNTIAAGYIVFNATDGNGGVVLWDMAVRKRLVDGPLALHEGYVDSVAFSPDGSTIAAGYGTYSSSVGSGGVVLWDKAAHKRLVDAPLAVKEGNVSSVAFSPDGKTVAAGYSFGFVSGGVVLWDVATGKRVADGPLAVNEGNVLRVAFSPGGKTLAAGYRASGGRSINGGVVLWDVATRKRVADGPLAVNEGHVYGVAFSPDGNTIAAGYGIGGGGGVVVWDLALWKRLADAPLAVKEGGVSSVAFSPDGKTLAAGCRIGVGGVVLWDVATRKRAVDEPLAVKEGGVSSVTFSPDGKTLAASYVSRRGGGVVRWDVTARKRLVDEPFATNEGNERCVAFSADSKTIAAGYDHGVALWDVDLESWKRTAGRIANRNFTRDEWKQYFPDEPYRRTFRKLPWPSGLPEKEREQMEQKEIELPPTEEVSAR